ncbi:MAG TPA: sulfatase [Gemmatimonadales bacterium]|nr:sulfatase [Gemmatimonadales bacterium]
MTTAFSKSQIPSNGPPITGLPLAAFAVWLGLVYGIIEAVEAMLWTFIPGGLSWKNGNAPPILWVAPLLYGLVFSLPGVLCAGLARYFPKVRWDVGLVFLLVGVGAYLAASLQGLILNETASLLIGLGLATSLTRLYRRRPEWWVSTARRTLPWLVTAVLCTAVLLTAGGRLAEAGRNARLPASPTGRPNILLLVIDTQRADHLSVYGYGRPTSPTLERMAREGWLFENVTASSSWTLPSHATMMTGRQQHEHRAGVLRRPYLDHKFPTIAELLRQEGYATGGFVANIYWCGRETGLGRGFIRYEDYFEDLGDAVARTVLGRRLAYDVLPKLGPRNIPGRKSAADINAHLLSWIDGLGDRPFFGFANYFDVHAPLSPPQPYLGRFSDVSRRPPGEPGVQIGAIAGEFKEFTPEQIQADIDGYDESILYVDAQIDSLLNQLEKRGKLKNTLIILTSDHGESFGEHGFYFHGHSLYREQVRIPLLLRWPARLPAGINRTEPVGLDEIAATIADAAGITVLPLPGRSLLAPPDTGAVRLSELAQRSIVPASWPASRGWVASLTTNRWHFITLQSGEVELYDFRGDPEERANLAADSTQLVERFRERFKSLVPTPIR